MAEKIECDTAGTIWKLMVAEGDKVAEGDTLFIMEVMKMEVPYEAPMDGTIQSLKIAEGDVVEEGAEALTVA